MGIQGLYSYLKNHDRAFKSIRLSKTKLIIDRNNSLYSICKGQLDHSYGGDFELIRNSCKAFFEALKVCEIDPYVIFDGAKDPQGSALKLARTSMMTAKKVSGGESEQFLPPFSHDIFAEVVEELEIEHVASPFNSDRDIASLAVQWNVPVLTNDSEFFIFDLPAGIIVFDQLNLDVKSDDSGAKYLEAKTFYFRDWSRVARINDMSLIPLFATLMGNNTVDVETLKPFYRKYNIPFYGRTKIPDVLGWLSQKGNSASAINIVEKLFRRDQEQHIREKLTKSVASYSIGKTYILDYVKNGLSADQYKVLNAAVPDPLPEWFQKALYERKLCSRISSILAYKCVFLIPQIESFKSLSSYLCGLPIRQLTNGILLRNCNQQGIPQVREYDRQGDELLDKMIKVQTQLKDGSVLPSLEEIPSLPVERKLLVILDLFKEEQQWFIDHPQKEQLFLAALTYWVYHANPKVHKSQVLSLLVYFYAPEMLKELVDKDTSMGTLTPCLESTISNHLEKRYKKKYFDINRIHNFSQFLTCFQSLHDLNQILQNPLQDISINSVFCGSSLSYICHHFESTGSEFLNKVMALDRIKDVMKMLEPGCCKDPEDALCEAFKRL